MQPQILQPSAAAGSGYRDPSSVADLSLERPMMPADQQVSPTYVPPALFSPEGALRTTYAGQRASGAALAAVAAQQLRILTTPFGSPPGSASNRLAGVEGHAVQHNMPPNMFSASLYVKNLPPDADKLFLYEHFAPFGAILSVKVLLAADSKKCRGVGFVNFAEHMAAIRAIQALHGTKVADKMLHVSLQSPRIH